jgi:EAL domain-containing protein (putative c-di-GMP-specific phosphodiesterase class I)
MTAYKYPGNYPGNPADQPRDCGYESDRLLALVQTGLLDTDPEPEFDTVVELASRLLDTPMATMTLIDDHRQWFKSKIGLINSEDPRNESLCAVAVDQNSPLVVSDVRLDERFADFPAVRRGLFVSYAGVPVSGRDGLPLGTLCVLDQHPRIFEPRQIEMLRSLGKIVGDELDLRRRDALLGLDPSTARRDTEALREGLGRDEFAVHFQPIVDLTSGRVRSVEALIRWNHPDRGLLVPGEFLPLAEIAGLGTRIDRWVLRSAAAAVAGWRTWLPELADLGVAVNVGLGPGLGAAWADEVRDVLTDTGLPADALTLEVSERSMDGAPASAHSALKSLVALGCRVAIDDIGTGTSSLARLAELPATEIKIDSSFVQSMRDDRRRAAVVTAVARLGQELDLDVVAEGVEDTDTADRVADAGCTAGQGYLWSWPVDAERLPPLLLDLPIRAQSLNRAQSPARNTAAPIASRQTSVE